MRVYHRLLFLIFVLIAGCRASRNGEFINHKTLISWGNSASKTSFASSTYLLKSNSIPDSVFAMQGLQSLIITGMDCDYGDRDSCWMISEIPASIKNLKELRSLVLTIHGIQVLPKEIRYLNKLTLLDLTDNSALRNIDEITQLSNLQNLVLYGCGLSSLPRKMGRLKNLRYLGLNGNPLPESEIRRVKKVLPDCEISF